MKVNDMYYVIQVNKTNNECIHASSKAYDSLQQAQQGATEAALRYPEGSFCVVSLMCKASVDTVVNFTYPTVE